jgi:ribosomal protein L11 methyltransferase
LSEEESRAGELRRASLRSGPSPAEEEALRTLVGERFPLGFEEERDVDGRLVLAVYVAAGEPLPAELGAWAEEAVEAGWEERWREFHHGAAIAGTFWVGPPWEEPEPGLLPVVIDPGRAFGTGQHATTRGCLELLAGLPAGGAVLDLGCGSGVLSIAAARLGFGPVRALDTDPLAVEATTSNAAANGVAVEVSRADVVRDPLPAAPLWLANILLGPLVELFRREDARPARAIVSGLYSSQPFAPAGYRETRRVRDGEWVALLLERD